MDKMKLSIIHDGIIHENMRYNDIISKYVHT